MSSTTSQPSKGRSSLTTTDNVALPIDVIADGQFLKRVGLTITSAPAGGGGGTPTPTATGDMIESTDGSSWSKRTRAEVKSDLGVSSADSPTFSNGLYTGNLTVSGKLFVSGASELVSERLDIGANYVLANIGYTTPVAVTGGLVVNYLPTSTTTAVSVTGFVAGVAAVSNPTVTVTSTTGFSAGHVVQVSNSTSNDGFYEVLTVVSGTVLRVAGVGLTGVTEPWALDQFTTEVGAGAITRVTCTVMRAGTDGAWETGSGSSVPLTYADVLLAPGASTITTLGTISTGTWSATALLPLKGGSGTWRSTSSGTDTLVATDGTVEFGASCTVTLPAASACKIGQKINLVASVAGVVLTLTRAGSDTIDGGTSVAITLPVVRGACGVVNQSSSAWGSVQPGSLAATAYECRLTGGSWFAYPQAWTGTAWVDVGAGLALTVEAAGSYTTSGATITIPSGTASNTTPAVTSSYRAYIALSSLSFWSTTFGSQYAVDLSCSFGSAVSNARWGYALCTPTGAYDANAETLFSERMGYTGSAYTTQVSQGVGTYAAAYTNTAVPTLSRVIWSPGVASAYQMADGTASTSGTVSIPTTLPTHLYVLGGAAVGSTGSSVVVTPSIRIIRLTG
jgi:hypothetical protein